MKIIQLLLIILLFVSCGKGLLGDGDSSGDSSGNILVAKSHLYDSEGVNLGRVISFGNGYMSWVEVVTSTGFVYSITFDGQLNNFEQTLHLSTWRCLSEDQQKATIQGLSQSYQGLLLFPTGWPDNILVHNDHYICYLTDSNPSGNVTETSNFIYSATVPAVGSERGDCNESDDGSSVGTLEDATVFTCSELTDELRKKLGFPESITPPLGLVVE